MNVNGIEITTRQSQLLRQAVHNELISWQGYVVRAETDIAAEYCRDQVRQCQGLLTLVTEQAKCDASAGQ